MKNFRSYDRSARFLLPPDLKDWVADDDLAHFIIEAVEHVDMSTFHVSRTGSGKAQYHPRMMLVLMIYCYASGIFSSRRIERATHRDVSARFITAHSHPDHDTIATFRRRNGPAFARAFEQILLLASEAGLLRVGTVSVDGTKIEAKASKIKSIRYDRLQVLRQKLAQDIAALVAKAEETDQGGDDDGLSLPYEVTRRKALKKNLMRRPKDWKRLQEKAVMTMSHYLRQIRSGKPTLRTQTAPSCVNPKPTNIVRPIMHKRSLMAMAASWFWQRMCIQPPMTGTVLMGLWSNCALV